MIKRYIKFFFYLLFSIISALQISAQTNITLNSVTHPGETSSDVWGFVDSNGIEYAVLGTRNTTKVYSLEDPNNPILRKTVNGANSIWRDMKSYGNYIYSIADQGSNGLLVIDMSLAPTTITHSWYAPSLNINGQVGPLRRCHNLFVDEDGLIYLSGCSNANHGVIIMDVENNPTDPPLVGFADLNYSHDIYVRDSFLYTSEIFQGVFGVYNISNPAAPSLVVTESTPFDFTHNSWLSDDSQTLFTTDEKANAYVASYDISDLGNISLLDRYRPQHSLGTGVIPHNVHVLNDYLVISYYSDGVIIVDAAQPDNLIEVGIYDTYTGAGTSYNGCWGAYPFLPSGKILASDGTSGLFVLSPTYKRASYLRGMVLDINTNAPIFNANIEIINAQLNQAKSDFDGEFATGIGDAGVYDVVVSHPSYPSDTLSVFLENGETNQVVIFLGDYTGPCQIDSLFQGSLPTATHILNTRIQSNGTIDSTRAIEFHANNEIELLPSFEVKLGGLLTVDTVGCP